MRVIPNRGYGNKSRIMCIIFIMNICHNNTEAHIAAYKSLLRCKLSAVSVPREALSCNDLHCRNSTQTDSINNYVSVLGLLTGRNRTGSPCGVGRPNAHAPAHEHVMLQPLSKCL